MMQDTASGHCPQIWIFGGANGSGKSTLYNSIYCEPLRGLPYVNADEILQNIQSGDKPNATSFAAGRIASLKTQALIDNRQDFVVESTLSGNYYTKIVSGLKKQGWDVNTIIVGCKDIEQSKARIKRRVLEGGHDISEDIVERRWPKTALNTAKFVALSTRGWLLDNSKENAPPVLVAQFKDGKVIEYTKNNNIPHIFDALSKAGLSQDAALCDHLDAHRSRSPQ